MQIGSFRFQVPGVEYTELARRSQRRWAARERHSLPPILEDLGRDADSITLTGTVWVRSGADVDAFAVLQREAGLVADEDAAPLPVFLGGGNADSGEFIGMWVVEQLHTRDRKLRVDGVPALISFSVRLKEYTAVTA